jgi:hypothetical protein
VEEFERLFATTSSDCIRERMPPAASTLIWSIERHGILQVHGQNGEVKKNVELASAFAIRGANAPTSFAESKSVTAEFSTAVFANALIIRREHCGLEPALLGP